MNKKKLWSLSAVICSCLIAPLHAENNEQSNQTYQDSDAYKRNEYRKITPNAGPRVAHGADLFITANFILWKAYQDGLEYAIDAGFEPLNTHIGANTYDDVPAGKTKYTGNDLAPGFKVGLGLSMCHDGWDIASQYTWLHASNTSSIENNNHAILGYRTSPITKALPPNLQALVLTQVYNPYLYGDKIISDWSLKFNVVDLELGRNFFLSQFLTMRPHFGVKLTWQSQNWSNKVFGSQFTLIEDAAKITTVNATGPFRSHLNCDIFGVGVRGGFDTAWYFAKSWSIYGDMAVTTMWTNYHNLSRKDVIEDLTTNQSKVIVDLNPDNEYKVNYIGEVELGLRWESWFYDDNYHVSIQAGWEQQVWLNWARFVSIMEAPTGADLTFQGLNLKFRFDF